MKPQTIESQTKQIRAYLVSGNSLTPIQALNKFGCFRLSGRIYDIQNGIGCDEIPVHRDMVTIKGKTVAKYSIKLEKLSKPGNGK